MKSLAAILVLLALAGCSTESRSPVSNPPLVTDSAPFPEFSVADSEIAGFHAAKAIVRAVYCEVESLEGGRSQSLRANMELDNGAQIRTAHQSEVYLQVNGLTSTIKIVEDSQLDLTQMMVRHDGNATPTRTALEVRKGTILGSVKKFDADSSFQVRGSGVTLRILRGDFQMTAEGRVTMVTGEGIVTSGGKSHHLVTGQSFDPQKNEVGTMPEPEFIDPSKFYWPGGISVLPIVDPKLQPWSASLSPFDRGLENARHGWVNPPPGN